MVTPNTEKERPGAFVKAKLKYPPTDSEAAPSFGTVPRPKVAKLLVILPLMLETVTEYLPTLETFTELIKKVLLVAPAKRVFVLKYHWYDNMPDPVAVTLNETLFPVRTVRFVGCCEMLGVVGNCMNPLVSTL